MKVLLQYLYRTVLGDTAERSSESMVLRVRLHRDCENISKCSGTVLGQRIDISAIT
jgi:hypothetical protein